MNTSDITDGARSYLEQCRSRVEQAAGGAWQKTCLDGLQKVTGLTLDRVAGYEVAFPSVIFGPAFSFPTRRIVEQASRMIGGEDLDQAIAELAVYYFKNLPILPSERDNGIFDVLGTYHRECGVVGALVELYWAKIAAHSAQEKFDIEQLAKVVMLHELAHYVTHQGCNPDGVYWKNFPSGEEVAEVVAQMATEDVILSLGDKPLKETFDKLLEGQSRAYTGHREVRECLGKIPGKIRTRLLKDFWTLFRDVIQKQGETLQSVDSVLTTIKAKEILETGTVITGIEMDI